MSTAAPSASLVTGEILDFLGDRARILVDGAATAGRYGLVHMLEMAPGTMPPLHVHPSQDEGFHVLNGELTLLLPGREICVRAGELVLAPRGVPHAYVVGDDGAEVMVSSHPAGFERFVSGVAALPAPDPGALAAVAAANGIELLGAPGDRP